MSDLSSIIAKIRNGLQRNVYKTETDVRTSIVLQILRAIGWDVFDPTSIRNEYSLKSEGSTRRVDLALCIDDKPRCILELKSATTDLDRGGTTDADLQLFKYAFNAGAPIALLTNGRIWKFYSIFSPGSCDERLVGKWSIEAEPDDLIGALARYLSFKNTITGQAAKDVRTDLDTKNRQRLAKNAIPHAWQSLLQDPDCQVVRLLIRATESLKGFPPTESDARDFLSSLKQSELQTKMIDPPHPKPLHIIGPPKPKIDRPSSRRILYSLLGRQHTAKNAKDAYVQVFERLGHRDAKFSERVALRLVGRKRRQLARTVEELGWTVAKRKRFVELRSGWFLNTNLSNSQKEKYLRVACEVAGIPFGDPTGLKISLPTKKRVPPRPSTVTSSGEAS